ncbi:BAG family molecular chaperone regulator 8, chloroplastic-like [Quillaja saponaria]|uniref:BAG family molecular chaperone regulator 8, chloroplastic-like n=1 Tax=Quillaja saponaria TaxID=32244 RepID=A0AAD7Q3W0_QUISA|nr:BAG family molecular chaperone regulator 8, chloroplastic-like [Quillaja saponaria]KAJ7974336.1 BAG family molecular chaperone regulator 8, chloroplastic-like [Quillaja saponaria]
MDSHYYHHHYPHQNQPLAATATNCCCRQPHHSHPAAPPPPVPTDPLLQAIASQLLQSNPHLTHFHTQYPKFQTEKLHNQQHYRKQRLHPQEQQTHFTIASLLCRIEALESSLPRFSSHGDLSSSSLRDLAARIIQTHFRAFLVRRSRTLRQLKDLALIKSSFSSLKSSISTETHIDFEALSHRAMDLLLKLDCIQGGDPMIRDGKRPISRDLVRFLDYVDGIAAKKRGLCIKTIKNARTDKKVTKSSVLGARYGEDLGVDQKEMLENLRDRVERMCQISKISENVENGVELEGFHQVSDDDVVGGGKPSGLISEKNGLSLIKNDGVLVKRQHLQPKVKKSVSFAENGNVYGNTYELVSSEDGTCLDESVSSDEQRELPENLCSEVEEVMGSYQGVEDDEETPLENGGSPQSSDGERIRVLKSEGRNERRGHFQRQNGKFAFSAPLPVKMEPRADLMNRKGVKINS